MKKHFLAASLLLSAATSFGAGYQLNLQGLRQVAMGGTGTAWPWDASTIYYNPGGLARLHSIQVYASMLTLFPSTAYGNQNESGQQSGSYRTAAQTFVPFNIYIGGPIQEDSKFAIGLGIYTAGGMGLNWDANWLGKYMVQSVEMKAVYFQPTLSYRITDGMSVGAGFVYGAGYIDLTQALPVHDIQGPNYGDGQAHLHGNSNGVGFNLGLQLKASDVIQFGATYRSQLNMGTGGGTAHFTVPQSLSTSFPNTTFDTDIPMPLVASVGVGYRPVEELTLQFDLNYTGWNSFDSFRINYTAHTPSLQDTHMPRHYRNTLTPRLGANYKISHRVAIMAGGAFDPTPVPSNYVSPDLPDADRIVVSAGLSVKPLRGFTILAAFEGTGGMRRDANYDFGGFKGVYKSQALTAGLGIYYSF